MNWKIVFFLAVFCAGAIKGECLVDDTIPPHCADWVNPDNGKPVFIEHVSNCSRFWVCEPNLVPCLFECPRADAFGNVLFFDVSIKYPFGPVCNWPIEINCTNKPIECNKCEVWQTCVEDNVCIPDCKIDTHCNDNEYCDFASGGEGECIVGCRNGAECGSLGCGICKSHQCIEPECCRDSDCKASEYCSEGECLEGCNEDSDCHGNGFCATCGVDNQCSAPECCVNTDCSNSACSTCGSDLLCINPECCSDDDCSASEYCSEGKCQEGCNEDSDCHGNGLCATCGVDNQCSAPECCVNTDCSSSACSTCGSDLLCINPECCSDDDCSASEYCSEGKCQEGCNEDSDCHGNGLCASCGVDNQCSAPECCVNTDCSSSACSTCGSDLLCINPECCSDDDCSASEYCSEGECLEGCNEDSDCHGNGLCATCGVDNQCSAPECCNDTDCNASKPICSEENVCTTGCRNDEMCPGFDAVCDPNHSNCNYCDMPGNMDFGDCQPGCIDDHNCPGNICDGHHICREPGSTKTLKKIILATESCTNCTTDTVEDGPILAISGGEDIHGDSNCTTYKLDHGSIVDYADGNIAVFEDVPDKGVLGKCYRANLQGEVSGGSIVWTARSGEWKLKGNKVDFVWSDASDCPYSCCLERPVLSVTCTSSNLVNCRKNCNNSLNCPDTNM